MEKAAKQLEQANVAAAQATAEEELARQYLQALTRATAGQASPQVFSQHHH